MVVVHSILLPFLCTGMTIGPSSSLLEILLSSKPHAFTILCNRHCKDSYTYAHHSAVAWQSIPSTYSSPLLYHISLDHYYRTMYAPFFFLTAVSPSSLHHSPYTSLAFSSFTHSFSCLHYSPLKLSPRLFQCLPLMDV